LRAWLSAVELHLGVPANTLKMFERSLARSRTSAWSRKACVRASPDVRVVDSTGAVFQPG
jgi:hypothetical protein